jgi:hypothetical protein
MKKIYITEAQLKHALKLREDQNSTEIPVDADALGKLNPSKQTEVLNRMKSASSTDYKIQVDVDDIQSPTELKQITEDMNDGINVPEQVVDFILNNYEDITCDCSVSELDNAIQDAYIECFGEEMEYDNKPLFREIRNMLIDRLCTRTVNESTIVFTKKQIKEAKRSKRIAESKVFTKADIVKNL